MASNGIIDFLKSERTPDELKLALEVLREFKECESASEWGVIPFACWSKLEQLEEFLDHLANNAPLEADTLERMKKLGLTETGPSAVSKPTPTERDHEDSGN